MLRHAANLDTPMQPMHTCDACRRPIGTMLAVACTPRPRDITLRLHATCSIAAHAMHMALALVAASYVMHAAACQGGPRTRARRRHVLST